MGALYMECSSKEMSGVDEIFEQAIRIVVANDASNSQRSGSAQSVPGVQFGVTKKKKRSCKIL
jgi:Ras homolog gene family, member A